jgi:hypothetical protein
VFNVTVFITNEKSRRNEWLTVRIGL